VPSRIRAGIVSSFPPTKCGVASYTARLTEELSKSVDLIVVADVPQDGGLNDPPYVLRVWRRNSLFYPFTIFWHVIRRRVDVVHIQHEYLLYGDPYHSGLFPILPLLLRLLDKKVVITMHSVVPRKSLTPDFFEKYGIGRRFSTLKKLCTIAVTKMIGFSASALIVHNKISKETLIRDYRFKPEKIHVIPHGVECTEMNITQSEAKKQLGLEGFNIILYFGFIRPGKGIEHLIEAMPAILREFPKTKLVIAGGVHPFLAFQGNSYIQEIKDLIEKLELERDVILTNRFIPEEELPLYFTASDIIVLPYTEGDIIGASGVLSKILSYSKPIVVTKVYRFSDVISSNLAIAVPKACPKALAEAIINLLSKPSYRKAVTRKLKTWAKENNWENVAKKTVELYVSLLRRSGD